VVSGGDQGIPQQRTMFKGGGSQWGYRASKDEHHRRRGITRIGRVEERPPHRRAEVASLPTLERVCPPSWMGKTRYGSRKAGSCGNGSKPLAEIRHSQGELGSKSSRLTVESTNGRTPSRRPWNLTKGE